MKKLKTFEFKKKNEKTYLLEHKTSIINTSYNCFKHNKNV